LLFFDICDFIILTLNLKMEAALEGCSFYLEKKLLLEITCHAYGLGTEVALASGEVSLRTFSVKLPSKLLPILVAVGTPKPSHSGSKLCWVEVGALVEY
jgi:hypothetical protein